MKITLLLLLLSLTAAAQPSQTQPPQGRQRNPEAANPQPQTGGAVAETVDETPIVTRHEINLNGKKLSYTATVAQMPIKNATGETEAHIFYMAYTLDGTSDPASRPA